MSAYIVEDEVINTIVSFLEMRARVDDPSYHRGLDCLAKIGYDLNDDDAEKLASDMFELNVRAINQWYKGEGMTTQFGKKLNFQYCFELPGSVMRALKCLECWSYQCCGGNIPEESRLYQAMEEVANALRYVIVSNLPEYQAASWG